MFCAQLATLPLIFGTMLIVPSYLSMNALLWGALAGVGNTTGMLAFLAAFRRERMAIVAPISGATTAIGAVIFGLLRGDQLSTANFVGIAACLAGICLVSASANEEFRPEMTNPKHETLGVLLAVLSGVAFATMFICTSIPAKSAGLWPLVTTRISIVFFGAMILMKFRTLSIPVETWKKCALWGFISASGLLFFRLGVNYGQVSVVSVLAASSPAFTAVLAWIVSKEHVTKPQIAGVIAAVAGIALLSL